MVDIDITPKGKSFLDHLDSIDSRTESQELTWTILRLANSGASFEPLYELMQSNSSKVRLLRLYKQGFIEETAESEPEEIQYLFRGDS